MSTLSSPSFDIPYSQRHRRQQQERNTGLSARPSVSVSPTQESDGRRPKVTFNNNDNADTQTLSPTRSLWTMMNRTSILPEIHSIDPAARLSRVTMSNSDFDTGGELSDLDFLNMSAGDYEPSVPATADRGSGSAGLGSRSGVYTGTYDGGGVVGKPGGIGGLQRGNRNESDRSSWSFASGLE